MRSLILLALILSACAHYIPVIEAPLRGLYGMAGCDQKGNPIIIVNEVKSPTTMIHERQHVADMMAYPDGCLAYVERYRNEPEFRLESELRAICAEHRAGANVISSLEYLAATTAASMPIEGLAVLEPCEEI